MKKNIEIKLNKSNYKVYIENGILSRCSNFIKPLNIGKKILIVTQDKIPNAYIDSVKQSLEKAGFKIFTLKLNSGEQYKNLDSLLKIINFAIKNKFERNDSFCALGGGIVSDLTGFAASIYYRGVNFLCLTTTLLGMVDAAIGGKTSINIKEGKNLLGTFYQPKIILIDPTCLKTLPKREILTGLGEVIKYALLEKTIKLKFGKKSFFTFLKTNKNKILKLSPLEIFSTIAYSAHAKAIVVSKDEKESNLREILNLGHTFAHGIEQAYNYKSFTHGEAVSIGMCMAAKLSTKLKMLPNKNKDEVIELIKSFGLPTKLPGTIKLNQILESMSLDKKAKNGKLRFILPVNNIGTVKTVSEIDYSYIKEIILDQS